MENNNFDEIVERALALRKKYHELERANHGSEWTVEEDVLAFLTDAGLVGRHTMSRQGRWPKAGTDAELKHKLGENIWWLIVLANRMDVDIREAVEGFLAKTEKLLATQQR